jgi:hypothetical protein
MVAYRLPSGTIVFLRPAAHQLQPQHFHSTCLPRSLSRTVDAHLVLRPSVDLVTTIAPAQIDQTAAFDPPSQLSPEGCCDDHLSPPWVP